MLLAAMCNGKVHVKDALKADTSFMTYLYARLVYRCMIYPSIKYSARRTLPPANDVAAHHIKHILTSKQGSTFRIIVTSRSRLSYSYWSKIQAHGDI